MKNNIAFLICITFGTYSHGMLKQSQNADTWKQKHALCIQKNDQINELREKLNYIPLDENMKRNFHEDSGKKDFLTKILKLRAITLECNMIYSIRQARLEEQKYDCQLYALAKTVGFKDTIHTEVGSSKAIFIDIFKYFKQTNTPKKNDLVAYISNLTNLKACHFGIVIDDNRIESKWGTSSDIVQHQLFHVPTSYGKAAAFFTLKTKFRALPNELLIAVMNYDSKLLARATERKYRNFLLELYESLGRVDKKTVPQILSFIEKLG